MFLCHKGGKGGGGGSHGGRGGGGGGPTCSRGCSHGGSCIGPNQCKCVGGWSGPTCNTPTCANPCVNGRCFEPDVCLCNIGYKGDTCADPVCMPDCVNGRCSSPGVCECEENFAGRLCQIQNCGSDLPAPFHGTAVCARYTTASIHQCHFACERGFGLTSTLQQTQYRCQNNGTWSPQPNVDRCEEDIPIAPGFSDIIKTNPEIAVPCSELTDEQKAELENIIRQRVFDETSGGDPELQLEDIEVTVNCPDPSLRRSADATEVLVKVNCNARDHKKILINDYLDYGTRRAELIAMYYRAKAMREGALSQSMKPVRLRGVLFREDSSTVEQIYFSCPNPDGQQKIGMKCINCSKGHFLDKTLPKPDCVKCPRHFYQDESGQPSCKPCPEGLGTGETGATSSNDCDVPLCKPGTIGNHGVAPCERCPRDTYQPKFGQSACLNCPGYGHTTTTGAERCSNQRQCSPGWASPTGLEPCQKCPEGCYQEHFGQRKCRVCVTKYTRSSGCKNIDECMLQEEVCAAGTRSDDGLQPCTACPKGKYQNMLAQSECKPCPAGRTTIRIGSTTMFDCSEHE